MHGIPHDITTDSAVHPMALHAAIQAALGSAFIGVSTGTSIPTRIHVTDALAAEVAASLEAILDAHDPVFLYSDKAAIAANGTELAMITVLAPKPSAAPVTLLIDGTPVPVTLTDGQGAISIVSSDPATIQIGVQNPANRTTDVITVEAS